MYVMRLIAKTDLVKHGPKNHRDNGAQMSKLIYLSISCEPVICEAEGLHTPASVGDLKIVGLWEAGKNGFLDYSIVNPDTPFYASQDWKTVSNQHAKEKHQKYDYDVGKI